MPDYAPLTKKQADYIKRCQNGWLNIAEGGKRAGKNITNLIAWAAVLDNHPDKLHLAAGFSSSLAKSNIIDSDGYGLMWIFEGRCKLGQYFGRDALLINTKMGEKAVVIVGGGDARSAALIKGMSLGTAYVTEANECHQTFINEVIDRTLASSKRQIFFDLNPKPPAHWFYADLLDYQDKLKAEGRNPLYNYEHFTIADNRSISHDVLIGELNKYDPHSIWFQRDILGKRTSASGRIYSSYRDDDVLVTPEQIRKMDFVEMAVGIDVGGTDATVATLTGLTKGYEQVVHIDGLWHKQSIDDKMSENMYAQMIVQWLRPWTQIYPKIGTIYVDSANKLFRTALRNELIRRGMGRYSVMPFNKGDGILQRIELTSMLMAQGRYKLNERMKKWREALIMATWSDSDFAKGEWVRVDDGSYPVDCLDSAEYSYYPFKRMLIK